MSLKWVAIGIAIAGVAIAAYGIVMQLADPMRVLSVGNVLVDDPRGSGAARRRLVTRTVAIGRTVRSEVELPNGTWIDCSGDCAEAVRKVTVEFWDERRKASR